MARPKKEVPEGVARFDVINDFVLENEDKLKRVIYGEPARTGQSAGGLIEKYKELELIPPDEVLAHYDKLGGYITKGIGGGQRVKIKNGAFWDGRKKQPRGERIVTKDKEGKEKVDFKFKPEVIYVFKVGGNFIEVDDPKKLAQSITSVESAIAEDRAKNDAKKARARAKRLTK